jgi:hypothetical protein
MRYRVTDSRSGCGVPQEEPYNSQHPTFFSYSFRSKSSHAPLLYTYAPKRHRHGPSEGEDKLRTSASVYSCATDCDNTVIKWQPGSPISAEEAPERVRHAGTRPTYRVVPSDLVIILFSYQRIKPLRKKHCDHGV